MSKVNKELMIEYLKDIANDVDNDKVDATQLQRIGLFLMEYKFNMSLDENEDITEKDLMRFLLTGWYIYTFVLKTKTDGGIASRPPESLPMHNESSGGESGTYGDDEME